MIRRWSAASLWVMLRRLKSLRVLDATPQQCGDVSIKLHALLQDV